jgi:hypothetical protein
MAEILNLSDFVDHDVDYIGKHNANNAELRAKVDPLLAQQGGGGSGQISALFFLMALFGEDPALVGYDSYKCTGALALLTVDPGTAWKPSTASVVQSPLPVTIDFTGQSAATYYIAIDAAGGPSRSSSATEAYYSVVWTGTAFGAITRLANCFMIASEEQALLHSTADSADYATLLARLEADEAAIAGGPVVTPGPFDDDTAAAAGGVALGGQYYLTGSRYVVVRTV